MTLQENVGVPPENSAAESTPPGDVPRFSRALSALVAAGTIAVAPIAVTALGPAESGNGAHSSPVYLLAQAAHDVGRNDWAFQGGAAGRVGWIVSYAALALSWLAVALWMRRRDAGRSGGRLWLRVLAGSWAAEFVVGALTVGGALYAKGDSSRIGPLVLRLTDVCSPWWSCVVALALVAVAERNGVALRAVAGYGALLAVLLLVPLPGPDTVKVLVLAGAPAAVALLGGPEREARSGPERLSPEPAAAG